MEPANICRPISDIGNAGSAALPSMSKHFRGKKKKKKKQRANVPEVKLAEMPEILLSHFAIFFFLREKGLCTLRSWRFLFALDGRS